MPREPVRWDRLHPRLQGVLHTGAIVPANQRAARNAYWFLLSPGRIEPAGWGDLSIEDLHRVATHLGEDEAFVPVREHAGILLAGTSRPGLDFDWWGNTDELPPVESFADAATFVVLRRQVHRVAFGDASQACGGSDAPELETGGATIDRAQLAVRLVEMCRKSDDDP